MEENENKTSKMYVKPVKSLVWSMGGPMILSMVLQALYNIVDTAFVINMPEVGNDANLALTYAFPVQIFMIALGVGTGIGINALLSRDLGSGNKEGVAKATGNGIFLGFIMYFIFLIFGLFLTKPFVRMQAHSIQDEEERELVIKMGSSYLTICCTLSLGQMLFTVYERFLQATGRNVESMIGQIAGAVTNIILDYVLIYPCNLGVAGAAYATVIGQFLSLLIDMLFHYTKDKEITNGFRYLKPDGKTIGQIMTLGIPAMIMQALLSVMMLGTNLILSLARSNAVTLQGAFGIYYKIQQIALFAFFGMSNALISLSSFNYGMGDQKRVKEIQKWGIIDSLIVALVITALFESLAPYIAKLFGMASGSSDSTIVNTTVMAIRLGSIGFVFMAASIAIQGLLQGLRSVLYPLLISLLRLAVFVFPLAYLFSNLNDNLTLFWLTFPISEILTVFFSFAFLHAGDKKKLSNVKEVSETN